MWPAAIVDFASSNYCWNSLDTADLDISSIEVEGQTAAVCFSPCLNLP